MPCSKPADTPTRSPSWTWATLTASSWWTTRRASTWPRVGAVIEQHPLFPNRVNVEFIRVEADGSVRMRVWERGVGETQACGTGATAVGAALVRLGLATSPVLVHLLGGDLIIEVVNEGGVGMDGPAGGRGGRRRGSCAAGLHDRAGRGGLHGRTLQRTCCAGWDGRAAGADGARPSATDHRRLQQGGDRAILPADGQPGPLSLRGDGAEDRREAQERGGCHQPGHRRPRSAHAGLHRRGDAAPGGRLRQPPLPEQLGTAGVRRGGGRRSTSAGSGWIWIPTKEFFPLLGAKEGLAHICWAMLDAGDLALVPDPGYPVYAGGSIMVGAEVRYLRLQPENGFLPDLDEISEEEARRAKVLFIGYPNNPTAAVVEDDFFERVVAFAKKYDVAVVHDNAYSELTYDGYVAPSFLAVPGRQGRGRGVLQLLEALQHDRLAHRLRASATTRSSPICGGSRPTWTRACSTPCSARRPSSSTAPGTSCTRCARSTAAAATCWPRL